LQAQCAKVYGRKGVNVRYVDKGLTLYYTNVKKPTGHIVQQ
jgi:hypothetical protein